MSDCGCKVEIENREQGRVLILLLAINAGMFVIEIIAGWLSESTALIADSFDMLADALVYAIGLYAVGRALRTKARAALASGMFQLALGAGVCIDVVRRFLLGSNPEPGFMLAVGAAALVANVICLRLIARHRDGEVHMRASWIFSKNDVIANLGVIAAGGLVHLSGSALPDLVIGLAIGLLVLNGGRHILRDAQRELALDATSQRGVRSND